jgi:hypothetical protein
MNQHAPRDLLLSCLHSDSDRLAADALPAPDGRIWDELLDLAGHQRVRSMLYHKLKRLGPCRRSSSRPCRRRSETSAFLQSLIGLFVLSPPRVCR